MKIIIERGRVWSPDELPNFSLALDGAVQGPHIDLDRNVLSFDHHDKCVRTFTRATCQQVMDSILLGFDPEGFTAYVNDVDGDTVLACWLLQNPRLAVRSDVRAIVEAVGAIDAHGPAYPLGEGNMLAEVFYEGVMAPEKDTRRARTYGHCDLNGLLRLCMERFGQMIEGENFGIDFVDNEPVHYVFTHQGAGWAVVYSEGFAFPTLYDDGYNAVVLYNTLPDGSWGYTIGKKSEFVNFPVGPASKPGTILHMLAAAEPGWGGGSSIGGAPRNPDGSRSRLSPKKVFELISALLGEGEHVGPEADDLPSMLSDEVLQAARVAAEAARAEED
jgi:hypothetical protein